jgi:L-aspartate semialdehyde sulfurtransferase ferredoxin
VPGAKRVQRLQAAGDLSPGASPFGIGIIRGFEALTLVVSKTSPQERSASMHAKMLVLRFSKEIVDKPIITNLVRNFNLSFNILKAQIYPRKEGLMVLELRGNRRDFEKGVRYLQDIGVEVESIAQGVGRNDDLCYQCGACTAVCPTGALHIQRPEMLVLFDSERCSACELCVKACPARAMVVMLDKSLEL